MEKLFAMNVAATLTSAVVSNLEDNLTVDVDIKDETLRAENLMTWELFRIFYHAVKGAVEDEQNWPAPNVDVSNLFEGASEGLSSIFQNNPIVREILKRFIGAIPVSGPVSIPNPGAER